jgi:hypothetical protein
VTPKSLPVTKPEITILKTQFPGLYAKYAEAIQRTIPKDTVFKKYNRVYRQIVSIGRKHGYAAAIHGSRVRDLDIIMVPWIEYPSEPTVLVQDICDRIGLFKNSLDPNTTKPHGRLVWTLIHYNLTDGGWVDLSVIKPRVNHSIDKQLELNI